MCCWFWIVEWVCEDRLLRNAALFFLAALLFFGGAIMTTKLFIEECCCYEETYSFKSSTCGECEVCNDDYGYSTSSSSYNDDEDRLFCQDKHDWKFQCATTVETIIFIAFVVIAILSCLAMSQNTHKWNKNRGNSNTSGGGHNATADAGGGHNGNHHGNSNNNDDGGNGGGGDGGGGGGGDD